MTHKHRYFWTILSIGLVFGVLVNVLSYWLRSDGPNWMDGWTQYGWPFIIAREGGFAYVNWFSWGNLALDVVIWTIAAALFALVLSRLLYARSIRGLNLCHQCHYDLRGSTGSDSCPECGAAIKQENEAGPTPA